MPSRQPGVPVTRLSIDKGKAVPGRWPYTIPAVRQILDAGLDLPPGATILIGENGSGKSTIVEAVAAAWGRRMSVFRDDWLHAQAVGFTKQGRWQERVIGPLLERSHGEGFLQVLAGMTAEVGLYVLDEPESALSFDSSLILLTIMVDMLAAGSQILLATHSPILAALPGAQLLQLDGSGVTPVSYDDADLIASWRAFLAGPDRFVRHVR